MSNTVQEPVYLEEKLDQVSASGRLDYRSGTLPTWCPGCGYFSIAEGVTSALNALAIDNKNVVIVSGIGCASRFPFFLDVYGLHTVHGRALPAAMGVKLANDALTVLVVGGDGDGFAIGGGHIPHAARRNVDLTYVLFDNGIYGMTKGQTSPTSGLGLKTSTTPYENNDPPLNPLMMVLSYGASWVGQAYAGQPAHLADMIQRALAHRGFSYLHVLSPCVTFDKTHKTYHNLDLSVRGLPAAHDARDRAAAISVAGATGHPALGLYFEEERPTLCDRLDEVAGQARAAARAAGSSPRRK